LIEGVILDLDGLIIDSESLSLEAWQRCLDPYGHTMDSAQHGALIGVSHEESARIVIHRYGLGLSPQELDRCFREHFHALVETAEPYPGLVELLDELGRRGLRLGIASNSPAQYVASVARRLGIAERFSVMVGADQVARPKPAPDVYLRAARGLGLAPQACLAAEDSPSGVEAAHAAGMGCVFIPNRDLPAANHVVAEAVYPSLSAWHADLDRLLPAQRT